MKSIFVPGIAFIVIALLSVSSIGADAPAGVANSLNIDCAPVSPTKPPCCYSSCINMSGSKHSSQCSVSGNVCIVDAYGSAVKAASVCVTWTRPYASALSQTVATGSSGFALCSTTGLSGKYTLTVTSVTINGYTFDSAHSTVTNSIAE